MPSFFPRTLLIPMETVSVFHAPPSTVKSSSRYVLLGAGVTRWHRPEPKHLRHPARPKTRLRELCSCINSPCVKMRAMQWSTRGPHLVAMSRNLIKNKNNGRGNTFCLKYVACALGWQWGMGNIRGKVFRLRLDSLESLTSIGTILYPELFIK